MAVNVNTKDPVRIMEMCKELKHVISLVYISAAYSNTNILEIEEIVYTEYSSYSPTFPLMYKNLWLCINYIHLSLMILQHEFQTFYSDQYVWNRRPKIDQSIRGLRFEKFIPTHIRSAKIWQNKLYPTISIICQL